MNWSCLKCGHNNVASDQECAKCGAKLPFQPPTGSTESPREQARFRVPRRGELTLLLKQGIDGVREGHIELAEFQERLEMAVENVPQVFAVIIEDVEEASEDMEDYGDGVATSLSDSLALFESGLTELLLYCKKREDFHLRFGWLLIEKGEEEYVRIMEALNGDISSPAFTGANNVVARMYKALQVGELTEEQYFRELEGFEAASHGTLEEIGSLLSEGVELAAEQSAESMKEAASRFVKAASTIAALASNLCDIEDSPSEG